MESGGAFCDTGEEVWDLLKQSGIDTWEVNEAFLHMHHQRGVSFEFSSRDRAIWGENVRAIELLRKGSIADTKTAKLNSRP